MIYNKSNLKGKLKGTIENYLTADDLRIVEIDTENKTLEIYCCNNEGDIMSINGELVSCIIKPKSVDLIGDKEYIIKWD